MKRLSNVTKRDLFDLFRTGFDVPDLWAVQRVAYGYYGRWKKLNSL